MKKGTVLILLFIICVAVSSCGKKNGTITSSSRYVTPAMIQQLQKKIDNMPSSKEESTDEEILKADIFSAFKRDAEKQDFKGTPPETEKENDAQPDGEVLAENSESMAEEQTQEKQLKTSAKTQKQPSGKENINAVAENETVYVSKTGKKFHKSPDCSNMTAAVGITRKEAENSGRTYCKKCYE